MRRETIAVVRESELYSNEIGFICDGKKQINNRQEKGITLVALVITIIIIIILSTITINVVFGDNGLIKQAEYTKDTATNATIKEEEDTNRLVQEYANLLAEDSNLADQIIIEIKENHTTESITIEVETNSEEEMTYEYYINGELMATQNELSYTTEITLQSKNPYIPNGFTHTEGTVDTGYVIQDTSIGNEFVWIPVKSGTYTAYVIAKTSDGNSTTSEEITIEISELTRDYKGMASTTIFEEEEGEITDKKSLAYFKQSVKENGGFYIGRYEMGMPGQKSGEEPTLELGYATQNVSGVPVCIGQVLPWTNIDWNIAKQNLESMYNGEVQSAMLNNYARATAINWIQDTGAKTYNDLRQADTWGNYNAWSGGYSSFEFKGRYILLNTAYDITERGNTNTYINNFDLSEAINYVLIETGADTSPNKRHCVNNIYDLAGNASEWSTDKNIISGEYKKTGGSCLNSGNSVGAIEGDANFVSGTIGTVETSSRPILYK